MIPIRANWHEDDALNINIAAFQSDSVDMSLLPHQTHMRQVIYTSYYLWVYSASTRCAFLTISCARPMTLCDKHIDRFHYNYLCTNYLILVKYFLVLLVKLQHGIHSFIHLGAIDFKKLFYK